MTHDPIVEEVREARQRHAARFNYDARAIFEDLKRKEQISNRKIVSYPPKRPTHATGV
ncbi:MAG: hypothetical protein ABSA16_07145 [Thermoguttaceae bacterium]|jgi:hypothetical protein